MLTAEKIEPLTIQLYGRGGSAVWCTDEDFAKRGMGQKFAAVLENNSISSQQTRFLVTDGRS